MALPVAGRVEGRVLGLACFPMVAVDANWRQVATDPLLHASVPSSKCVIPGTELVQEGRQASAERRIPYLQFSDQTRGRHSESPA